MLWRMTILSIYKNRSLPCLKSFDDVLTITRLFFSLLELSMILRLLLSNLVLNPVVLVQKLYKCLCIKGDVTFVVMLICYVLDTLLLN